MTNLQLYVAIGIPTLAVLLGIFTNAMQMSALNSRFSSMDVRFNTMEARFNSLEARIDARFNSLELKIEMLTGKVIDLDNRVTRIEAKLDH